MPIEPDKHLRLGPSRAHRWLKCGFSITDPRPSDDTPTSAAVRGKHIHALAAQVLTGEPVQVENQLDWAKYSDTIEPYVNHIRGNHGERIEVETFLQSPTIPDYGGTCDAYVVQDDAVAVYDLKTGRWPVAAIDNPQLLCYADIIHELWPQFREFYGVIVQPHSNDFQMVKPIADITLDQLAEHRENVWAAAESIAVVTGDHCRFCPKRLHHMCPEGTVYGIQRNWN